MKITGMHLYTVPPRWLFLEVETDAGIVKGERRSRDTYRVWLNVPGVLDLERKPDCAYVELGNPGIPHAVKEIPDLTWDMG